MVGVSLVFLTPWAALVGLAFVVPLLAVWRRERAGHRARGAMGLDSPGIARSLLRPLALVVVGALVAATAAQPALRTSVGAHVRSDAEIYLTYDVTRSMLATSAPGGVTRLERARRMGRDVHEQLLDLPTGVATITNRMMPLLFPTGDERGVSAVLARAVRILQPAPARLSADRATQLGVLTLAADRSYFNPGINKRLLVVFSDLDSDYFSLDGTLRILRRHGIEPFVVRVARPGERIFAANGTPLAYRSISTVTVSALRAAGWHAFEESEGQRVVREVRGYLGDGPTHASGVIVSQRSLAVWCALVALLLVAALTLPTLAMPTTGAATRPAG